MLIEDEKHAPLPDARLDTPGKLGRTLNGMIYTADGEKPGRILQLWLELRRIVGTVVAKKKDGVKFKVRSAEDLIDQVRAKANELGILIYPRIKNAKGHVVEDGTLAEQELEVWAQAVEDGSQLMFGGFGLGADNQDKAGGKAGTYAFKAALIQALLAGGSGNAKALGVADTDDSDSPIPGGVKKPSGKPKTPTDDEVKAAFDAASDEASYKAAVGKLRMLPPDRQIAFDKDAIRSAQVRCGTAPVAK